MVLVSFVGSYEESMERVEDLEFESWLWAPAASDELSQRHRFLLVE